jgi:HK97 family phage prohead protease
MKEAIRMDKDTRLASMWADDQAGIRSAPGSDGMTLTGYAAVFGTPSSLLRFPGMNRGKPFREIIEPSAFNRMVKSGKDVLLLWQHDPRQLPLASTAGGTMRLSVDGRGLRVEATLPDNEHGRPYRDAIARGDVRGMSFRMMRSQDNARPDGTFPVEILADGSASQVRRIREVELMPEVSITNMPAYVETSASIRSIAEDLGVDADALESAMRSFDAGTLTFSERDVIIDAASLRAVAAMACCPECGDQAPGCCATDSRCPAGCTGADCTACSCDATAEADDVAPATARADDPKLAQMRSSLEALRAGIVRHTQEPHQEPSAGATTEDTTSPAGHLTHPATAGDMQ